MSTCTIPSRAHQAEAGLLLCRHHLEEMAEWLHDIEHEVEQLDARPSMAIVWDRSGGSLASHQAPARLAPIVHADRRRVGRGQVRNPAGLDDTLSAFGTLHSWAQMVRDGRNLARPGRWIVERILAPAGPLCGNYGPLRPDECAHTSCRRMVSRHFAPHPLSVTTERQLLTRHLDWAAGQPWATQLWADLGRLRSQLKAANGTSDPKPLPGRCPELVDGVECGGPLWPVSPKHTSGAYVHVGADVLQAVECAHNQGHRWEAARLRYLALTLIDQQRKDPA